MEIQGIGWFVCDRMPRYGRNASFSASLAPRAVSIPTHAHERFAVASFQPRRTGHQHPAPSVPTGTHVVRPHVTVAARST